MTNGEKLKEIFPDTKIITQYDNQFGDRFIVFTLNNEDMQINLNWWNAEYKEPTTKSYELDKKLEKDFGESDCISRQAVLEQAYAYGNGLEPDGYCVNVEDIQALPSVTPQEPRCRECKWWKDSDGEYRRGLGAESKCPINNHAVYSGEGYCYKFSPKADMREVKV